MFPKIQTSSSKENKLFVDSNLLVLIVNGVCIEENYFRDNVHMFVYFSN